MELTPHFSLEELTVSETAARRGIDNVPSPGSRERHNLKRLAEILEEVRTVLNNLPVLVTSGYRNPTVNAAVGGSKNSAHLSGLAADFICPGFGSPLAVCRALRPHLEVMKIDQLIYEFETWVHLGLTEGKPRHMAMTIDARGTRTGFG